MSFAYGRAGTVDPTPRDTTKWRQDGGDLAWHRSLQSPSDHRMHVKACDAASPMTVKLARFRPLAV
jgi:hypothetical protein